MHSRNSTSNSNLSFHVGGKTFCYDEAWITEDNRVVRICEPTRPHGGHQEKVPVQYLIGEDKVYMDPDKLFSITAQRKAKLPKREILDLSMYNYANEGFSGVETVDLGGGQMRLGRVINLDTAPRTQFMPLDDAWIQGLVARADLNGNHVILHRYMHNKGRWQCVPTDWKFEKELVCVKPENLTRNFPADFLSAE